MQFKLKGPINFSALPNSDLVKFLRRRGGGIASMQFKWELTRGNVVVVAIIIVAEENRVVPTLRNKMLYCYFDIDVGKECDLKISRAKGSANVERERERKGDVKHSN